MVSCPALGVLFMDESNRGLTHPYFASVLNAFKVSAEARSYDVTFIGRCIGRDKLTYLEYCQLRNLDGVCIACIDFGDPMVEELVKSGIPCVTVDHIFRKVPAVLSDNETGAQEAARELGLRIPEDLSVAGFDGIPLAQELRPRLTTIRQDSDGLGEEAARRLIDRIENEKNVSFMPAMVPVRFLIGGTVAQPS